MDRLVVGDPVYDTHDQVRNVGTVVWVKSDEVRIRWIQGDVLTIPLDRVAKAPAPYRVGDRVKAVDVPDTIRARVIEMIVQRDFLTPDTDAADLALDELIINRERSDKELARLVAQRIAQA